MITIHNKKRVISKGWRLLNILVAIFLVLPVNAFSLLVLPTAAEAVAVDQINICHTTASPTNPYNQIFVDKNATANGHDGHDYGDVEYSYDGKNWDAQGQAIWNNECEIPAVCGNEVIEQGETCDGETGTFGEHQACGEPQTDDACQIIDLTYCGDGTKQTPNDEDVNEECDRQDGVTQGFYCNESCELVEEEVEPITISAQKVVCLTEADLPNWGTTGVQDGQPTIIDTDTAQEYVDNSDQRCWLEEGWDFQWGQEFVDAKAGDFIGLAGNPWKNFNSSTGNGGSPAVVEVPGDTASIDTQIWVRESLKEGYIPFANPDGSLQDNVSAEIYCHNDILNFDNYDKITDPQAGTTYYCVAFNTTDQECGNEVREGDEACDDGPNGSDRCTPDCELTPVCDDQELVLNGSFETPEVTEVTAGAKWDIFPSGTFGLEWLVEWLFPGQSAPHPANLELHRGVNGWLPSEGDQYAELDTDYDGPSGSLNNESASVKIYQDIATVPGRTYEISFDFSPRPNTNSSNNSLKFSWDDILRATINEDGTGNSNNVWSSYSYQLTASGWTTKLEFADAGTPDSFGTFLDNVSVTCVPCDDSVYVRVNFLEGTNGVDNHENGDMQRKIYTGDGTEYNEGDWILIYQNGVPVVDPSVNLDQPGLVLERGNGWVRPVLYGRHDDGSWEIANGVLEFSNGTIFTAVNDSDSGPGASPHHPFENQGDGIPPTTEQQMAGQDEYFATPGDASSDFYMMVTTADDSYYLYYNVTEVCEDPVCGNNIIEGDEGCDGTNIPGQENGYSCDNECNLIAPPICGDGLLNRREEQCDGDVNVPDGYSCNDCQLEGPAECSDLVLARVWIDEVVNTGDGNLTTNIYLGSDSNVISSGEWFVLYSNGSYETDPDISGYEDVPGLAVQRLTDQIRLVMHAGHPNSNHSEFANGFIELYNANVTGQSSDNSGDNKLEDKGAVGSGIGKYDAGDDEVWITGSNKSNFWLGGTTADDGFYTDWQIIEDCSSLVYGKKWHDRNETKIQEQEEPGLPGWEIIAARLGDLVATLDIDSQDTDGEDYSGLETGKSYILKVSGTYIFGSSSRKADAEFSSEDSWLNYVKNLPRPGTVDVLDLYFNGNDIDWGSYNISHTYYYPYISDGSDINLTISDWYETGNTQMSDNQGELVVDIYETDEQSVLTDGNGDYSFDGLDTGDYLVYEVMKNGWYNTTPWYQFVTVNEKEEVQVNFGNNYESDIEPNSICGYKFNDYDRNGDFDNDDQGIAGWNIFATNGEINYSPTQTNEDGYYCFNAMIADTWQIYEEMIAGWLNTTDATQTVPLADGQGIGGINFGNYLTFCGDGIKQTPNGVGSGGPQNDGNEACDGQDGVITDDYACTQDCILEYIGPECNTDLDCSEGQICFENECYTPECTDADQDGYGVYDEIYCPAGNDCDDNAGTGYSINPGATEICDGIDNNCDGNIDEDNVCGQEGPYCGDGSCNNSETCSTCPGDCGSCGGGGGGGGAGAHSLIIHTIKLLRGTEAGSVIITWLTNIPATSRVVYDLTSHPAIDYPPNYGYQWSTGTTDTDPKVLSHSVTINSLLPATVYYFRPISAASPEVYGDEVMFTLEEAAPVEPAPAETPETPPAPPTGGEEVTPPPATGGIVAGTETEEGGEVTEEEAEVMEEPEEEGIVAAAEYEETQNCALYIWILLILNLAAVIFAWYKGKDSKKALNKNLWWISAAVVIVLTVLGYPQCWLAFWLIVTLIVIVVLALMSGKRQVPERSKMEPTI